MKPSVIVSLSLLFLTTAGGQTRTTCPITIPAGAITNGESLSLSVNEVSKIAAIEDPALKAFSQSLNDTGNALSFYDRVSNTPAMQEDETLRIVDEEVLYGEALACQGKSCHLVFIRPTAQIAHHWLVTLQRDFKEFEEAGSTTAAGAKFIADLKTADEQKDSVWSKLSALYCHLEPDGKYRDLGGSVVFCRDFR